LSTFIVFCEAFALVITTATAIRLKIIISVILFILSPFNFKSSSGNRQKKAELPLEATRLSYFRIKTRGFPSPDHSGFGFV